MKITKVFIGVAIYAAIAVVISLVDMVLTIGFDITIFAIPAKYMPLIMNVLFIVYFSYSTWIQCKSSFAKEKEFEMERETWAMVGVSLPVSVEYKKYRRQTVFLNGIVVVVNALSIWFTFFNQ